MKDPIETYHYRYNFETSEPLIKEQIDRLNDYIQNDLWNETKNEDDIPWIVSYIEQTKI